MNIKDSIKSSFHNKKVLWIIFIAIKILLLILIIIFITRPSAINHIKSGIDECGVLPTCAGLKNVFDSSCYYTIDVNEFKPSPAAHRSFLTHIPNYRSYANCTGPIKPSKANIYIHPAPNNICNVYGSQDLWGYVPNSPACAVE